jgi:hypothetical protein
VTEQDACTLLKQRFEAAGLQIASGVAFDEDGVQFEMDGFDAARRVGFEYVTAEAGDSWDVGGDVIAELAARRKRGELYVLVVDEGDAPDAKSLGAAADTFLAELRRDGVLGGARDAAAKPAKAAKVAKPAKAAKPAAAAPKKAKAKKS